jgi:glyoxylase-like metal-dependent hydrolase (beta-lactamase superfamily II)
MGNFGLSPDDIDCVFITHWHRDHFGNIGVFKDAEIIVLKSLADHFGLDFTGVSDVESIAEGVNVLATPGHTEHHASVVLQISPLRNNHFYHHLT